MIVVFLLANGRPLLFDILADLKDGDSYGDQAALSLVDKRKVWYKGANYQRFLRCFKKSFRE